MSSSFKALWHRHWVDTWGGLLVATLVTLALAAGFAAKIILDAPITLTEAETSMPTYAPLSVQSDARALTAWSAHAFTTVAASLFLILFIHGTGIRSNDLNAAHPSIYFNLTLPVSRSVLVATRFAMSLLCAAGLIGLLFSINTLVLGIVDYPIPAKEMAQTSLLGFLFLVAATWICDLASIVSEVLALWLIPLTALAVIAVGWDETAGLIAGHAATPARMLAFAAIAALALALSIVIAHKRDF